MSQRTQGELPSSVDVAFTPIDLIRTLRTHAHWWLSAGVVCAVIAAVYSLIAPRDWKATQALIVRPAAAGVSEESTGKFNDLSEMKTLQETILELAKSQNVLRATLTEVGPPVDVSNTAKWPSPREVDTFRDAVDMRPPGGAEFGKTEVFYLSVKDANRDRARRLVAALTRQLEHRMQEIRHQRAQGMILELERTVAMATSDLDAHTARLSKFEATIGSDLAELRNLNSDIGGQGEVAQELQAIKSERRANEARHRENVQLLELLTEAQVDTEHLLATPNALLESQPAVRQLKSALIDAQVYTANLSSSRLEAHPFVKAALDAESRLRAELHEEIAVAIRGLQADIALCAARDEALGEKAAAARTRLSRLARARADYNNLVTSVTNYTNLLESARTNLADARAQQAGAQSASIISRIDGVDTGIRPVGPSRKTITAAGGVAGILLGLGTVFLTMPPAPPVSKNSEPVELSPASRNCTSTRQCAPSAEPTLREFDAFARYRGMSLEEAVRHAERLR